MSLLKSSVATFLQFPKKVYQTFTSNMINFLTLWMVSFGFITTVWANNTKVTWMCYPWHAGLVIFGILYNVRPHFLERFVDFFKLFHLFLLTLGLAFNFISTTELIKVIRSSLYDEYLLDSDKFLFPRFPQGTLSLFVDQSSFFNPTTFSGKMLNEYFELIYITFYVWGYLSLGVCALEIVLEARKERLGLKDSLNNPSKVKRYVDIEYLVMCWTSTFSIIFLINIFVPGKSPRIYLKDEYTTEITGFGFTKYWRGTVDRDDSSGTFPSGHVGETIATAFGIYYSHKTLGKMVFVMGSLIALATAWNRYHYISDLLMGAICAMFGYLMANIHLQRCKRAKGI
ncbi:hypothetical protein EIN_198040 [Entamoeba invadens IP1]|uniref:Phosphatidic acid phosphatase type 2/haloperoxidase domain-containing protein n=1 Tax=Entamoeba invadens IP1 TaxID=370355 RepID=A0A0A1TZB0_ENTIV|nr:hypothetical protein EIN_198040 [Entamoeba invadens IP1]ELP83851.1 hypothetical protein EIN_198040 [Entamoeba invadens IP1]|eukprot:XP_004183197.1 hypothetical protein EIN_198040 [Entamoeba invadens IP1]